MAGAIENLCIPLESYNIQLSESLSIPFQGYRHLFGVNHSISWAVLGIVYYDI